MAKILDLKLLTVGDAPHDATLTFDEFYAAYPRKRARKDALKAWAQVSIENRSKILPALAAQKQSADWRKDGGAFIPYPATWLRGERWDDDLEVSVSFGQCSWNRNGNRGSEPRCTAPGTTEKHGVPYCQAHADRIN